MGLLPVTRRASRADLSPPGCTDRGHRRQLWSSSTSKQPLPQPKRGAFAIRTRKDPQIGLAPRLPKVSSMSPVHARGEVEQVAWHCLSLIQREQRMSVRKTFRALMAGQRLVLMPGAYDALSARVIEAEGFDAIVAGGYAAIGSMLAQADMGQS